ncbi:MAG: TraB/GumN family protein [Proteobacteria bacterium]|nr:TraB/GumN family protein [Pseudomonadota bacterium]
MRTLALVLMSGFVASPSMAQQATTTPAPAEQSAEFDAVTVQGVQPGPGLWQAQKNGHSVWILATVAPLPDNMTWNSKLIRDILADSKEIIYQPSVSIDADIGIFKGLFLFNSLRKMDENPGGQTLQQVLPPAAYARWSPLKARYLANDDKVERKRPMFAAGELLKSVYKAQGLGGRKVVSSVLDEAIKQHGIKVTSTSVKVKIADPGKALKEFANEKLGDEGCLSSAMALAEHDLPAIKARANAWARGDVARLRQLPIADTSSDCVQALMDARVASSRGITNLPARFKDNWLKAMDAAVANNDTSLAVVSLDRLVGKEGYLDALRARGYEITEP